MIKQIVSEMRSFAFKHPYDPEAKWPISEDYSRDIEYKGRKLSLVFSLSNYNGLRFWQLTISNRADLEKYVKIVIGIEKDENGEVSKMPIPKELRDEIAKQFFPTSDDIVEFELGPTHQYAQLYKAENN